MHMLCIYLTSKGGSYTSLWETTINDFSHALVIDIVEKNLHQQ